MICQTYFRAVIAVCVSVLPFSMVGGAAKEPIAVVVNDSSAITDIKLEKLARYYLGKVTLLPDGSEIVLLAYAPLEEDFYKAAVKMTTLGLRKHWMKLVFEADYATPPTDYNDLDEIKGIVCKTKGAICFVPLSKVSDCMKVLTIDGKSPGDEGYALK